MKQKCMKNCWKGLKKRKRFYKKRKIIKEKEKVGVNLRPDFNKEKFTFKKLRIWHLNAVS